MGEILDTCNKGGCQKCIDADCRYEELLALLSSMHVSRSTDAKTLCCATFHDFDMENENFLIVSEIQGELFQLADMNLLPWTKI